MQKLAVTDPIPVEGGHLEGWSSGAGAPVLLIHGSIMADTFRCIEDHAGLAGYRLLSYRRRGFCGSAPHAGPFSIGQQAADARAALAYFGVDRAHVVGHSYGGCTAIQLTLDAPEVVHSLALLEPPIFAVPAAADFGAGLQVVAGIWQAGDKVGATTAFVTAVAGPNFRTALDKTLPAGWFDQAVADIDGLFAVETPALVAWTFGAEEAARITQPVLNVVGAESDPLFQQGFDWLAEHIPHAEPFRLPNATHLLQAMNPADLAAGLAAFLDRHPLAA